MNTTSTNEYGDKKIRQSNDMKRTYKINATPNLRMTLKNKDKLKK